MELKNAVAVCLISLFSATLVVLIARALTRRRPRGWSRSWPRSSTRLQAIRKQGGIAASPGNASNTETAADGLVVYYFHGNTRCPTCQSIESQANDTVHNDFASQLSGGEIVWKVLNYEQSANEQLVKKFAILMPVVVLAKMKAGQVADWKRLDKVWAVVGDKPAFAKYVRDEITRMLAHNEKRTDCGIEGRAAGYSASEPRHSPRRIPPRSPGHPHSKVALSFDSHCKRRPVR